MIVRALAALFNALPVHWQRGLLDRMNARFLVGVVALCVDERGHVLLARHRFGSPEWRFLGGFMRARETPQDALAREVREETGWALEVGPILEANAGFRWARVELVYACRIVETAPQTLSGEVLELGWFDQGDALPAIRADQRGLIERHAAAAARWARGSQ